MINLQGLQYPSLQELSRFLPGPGLALPGLQEKQVSLSSQNLKVKSGALIWYICTLLYLTYILWDQSWGRKKLKACHNSNRFTIWRSQEGKVVAKVCPVQWWPLLPKFNSPLPSKCFIASLPHLHLTASHPWENLKLKQRLEIALHLLFQWKILLWPNIHICVHLTLHCTVSWRRWYLYFNRTMLLSFSFRTLEYNVAPMTKSSTEVKKWATLELGTTSGQNCPSRVKEWWALGS